MKTKKVMYEYKILTIIDKLQERIKLIVFKTGTLPRELFFSKYIPWNKLIIHNKKVKQNILKNDSISKWSNGIITHVVKIRRSNDWFAFAIL